jgi:hypothetical protein
MFGLPLGRKRKASARRQIDRPPCMYDAADTGGSFEIFILERFDRFVSHVPIVAQSTLMQEVY